MFETPESTPSLVLAEAESIGREERRKDGAQVTAHSSIGEAFRDKGMDRARFVWL